MLSYLEKFNNLPSQLRDKVSSEKATAAIAELEKKYNVSLAVAIMKAMVKEIAVRDMPQYFVFEYNLRKDRAEALVEEMKEKIFSQVADYLGLAEEKEKKEEAESLEEWLELKKRETQRREAKFYFSPEDEEEVKKIAGNMKDLKTDTRDREYEEILDKVVNELKFNFSSEELHKRFRQVMNTYIRGIRNKIDSKQTLMKKVAAGGLDLNDDLSSKALTIADKIKNEYKKIEGEKSAAVTVEAKENLNKITAEEIEKKESVNAAQIQTPPTEEKSSDAEGLKRAGVRDVEYDFSALAARKSELSSETVIKEPKIDEKFEALKQPEKDEEFSVSSSLDSGQSELEAVNARLSGAGTMVGAGTEPDNKNKADREEKEIRPFAADLKKENLEPKIEPIVKTAAGGISRAEENKAASSPIASVRRQQKTNGKIKIEDVKKTPKLTGPVDELGEMDLVDFRRLNPDPQVAVKKIKEKIEALEEEGGYARRLAGIQAWRQSPLNHLYLQIGQESMNQRKSINEITGRRRENGENYLTLGEFNAIMELNRELRF